MFIGLMPNYLNGRAIIIKSLKFDPKSRKITTVWHIILRSRLEEKNQLSKWFVYLPYQNFGSKTLLAD